MKRILLVAILLLSAESAFAQTRFPKNYQHANTVYSDGPAVLGAAYGGTNITAGVVGDLLVISGTTPSFAYSRIAAVASGSVLASAGTSTVPTWSSSPTLSTSLTTPLVIGGTAASSTLSLRATSGVGTSSTIIFQVGNNGATEAGLINNSGIWLLGGTTVTTNASLGDIVLLNNTGQLRFQTAAANDTLNLIGGNSSNQTLVGHSSAETVLLGSDIKINRGLTALGGGAAPTFGTIGGSGPTTAGQNSWQQFQDDGGNSFWVPVWK